VNLKPCPFCGEDAEHIHVYQYEEIVRCTNECCFVRPSVTCELPEECEELWNRRTVSGQEAVAKVVPPDVYPGYGWHAEALIDWEKIGAGTLLYAYPIPATFEQKCTVSTPNTAKKSAKGLATLLFGGDDSEEATAPIPATEQKDAEQ
jgi:hypothetical protein